MQQQQQQQPPTPQHDLGSHPAWTLPLAAWQEVAARLRTEDLVAARLACSAWARDLGAFVLRASVPIVAAVRVEPDALAQLEAAADRGRADSSSGGGDSEACDPALAELPRAAAALLAAFPHCLVVGVGAGTLPEQVASHVLLNALAGGSCADSSARQQPQQSQQPQQRQLRLCLDALPRSYHCRARQDCPASPPDAGPALFRVLRMLPQRLTPQALGCLVTLQLGVFPSAATDWQLLSGLPALRELRLPPYRPALPHEQLLGVAQLTQLRALTLSVQGSFTSWRANCESFAALSSLTCLTRLNMHAFHCPGSHLALALMWLQQLRELRLSGRIVLQPLLSLLELKQLRVLELTQDCNLSAVCLLQQQLCHLTQLALGRITLPPSPAAAAQQAAAPAAGPGADVGPPGAAPAQQPQLLEQPGPAAGAAAAGAPAAAAAAAAFNGVGMGAAAAAAVAAGGAGAAAAAGAADGAAAAAAAAPGGGGGEVMLEDVGAIVDGLIGNLQEGAVPLHLQRIIERFESLVQLDVTRRGSCSPWTWPMAGLSLLQRLATEDGGTGAGACAGCASCGRDAAAPRERHSDGGSSAHASSSGGAGGGVGGALGCSLSGSMELALLRPADVARLRELPAQLRCGSHLALRLRDQLLAFASVCPVRLLPGQLGCLGPAFGNLASLSLCGKVAMDGQLLEELAQGLASCRGVLPAPAAAGAAGRGLQVLCLDLHFMSVSADAITAALQELPSLQVLSLRHRGAGKLLLPLSALPASLTMLALKKVLLFQQPPQQQQQQRQHGGSLARSSGVWHGAQPLRLPRVAAHAITSPGFRHAISTHSISAADLPSLAATAADGGAAAAHGVAGQPVSCGLPNLRSLHLKLCCVPTSVLPALLGVVVHPTPEPGCGGGAADQGSGSDDAGGGGSSSSSSSSSGATFFSGGSQLTQLSVAGDSTAQGEVWEGWHPWLAALKQLRSLQVLDLSVPESLTSSLPDELLDALLALPRLSHLHLCTGHAPQQLLGLTRLAGRLATLGINYTGPPSLPGALLDELQQGLGLGCRVQLWEQVVMQQAGSFGPDPDAPDAAAGQAGGAPRGGRAGRRAWWRQRGAWGRLAVDVGSVVLGGWCGWRAGWLLGCTLRGRHRRREQARAQAAGGA